MLAARRGLCAVLLSRTACAACNQGLLQEAAAAPGQQQQEGDAATDSPAALALAQQTHSAGPTHCQPPYPGASTTSNHWCTSSSSSTTTTSSTRSFTSSTVCVASAGGDEQRGDSNSATTAEGEEVPRRRRRSATESNAVLRRTTESRAAIEDVAVMSRSQLLRRNKPWLAEQCWQHGLSHEGLKEDLIQRLLAWQDTDAGHAAAAAAQAAAATARAALTAATAAAAASKPPAAPSPPATASKAASAAAAVTSGGGSSQQQQQPSQQHAAASWQRLPGPSESTAAGNSSSSIPAVPPVAAAAATGEAAGVRVAALNAVARPAAAACAAAVAVQEEQEAEDGAAGTGEPRPDNVFAAAAAAGAAGGGAAAAGGGAHAYAGSSTSGTAAAAAGDDDAHGSAESGVVGWQQPPLSAAAAVTESMGLFLGQLKQQPGNAAIVAAARNAVEQYAQHVLSTAGASTSGNASMQQQVSDLAATLAQFSSPQSLAALAKACYSRELQNPVLAASLAEAVATAAPQLGPQEVYGVLRLLVEHLTGAGDSGVGFNQTMDKGFRVLAEAMIRCSEALQPVQLAEAIELLGVHNYGDAFGLWLIAKEAAARLSEFDPAKEGGSVVRLLDAIAGMHVADDAMTADVAAAVEARKSEYSEKQLSAVAAALQRMGYVVDP